MEEAEQTSTDDHTCQQIAKIVFCVLGVFLSAFAGSVSITNDAWVYIEPNSLQTVIFLIISSILLFILYKKSLKFSWVVFFIAVLFALFTVFGMQLNTGDHSLILSGIHTGYEEHAIRETTGLLVNAALILAFVGYAVFYYLVVLFVYNILNRIMLRRADHATIIFGTSLNAKICALVLFALWLPYIIYFFPGLPNSDTSRQLAQYFGIAGLSPDTHFPYLVSLFFGTLYQVGCLLEPSGYFGTFLMTMSQVIFGLFLFSKIVIWLDRLGADRRLVLGTLAFFALFPLIPTHLVTISKDTLHTELLTLFALQIILFFAYRKNIIERSYLFSPVSLVIVAILVSLTRNNGIILVLIAFFIMALTLKEKRLFIAFGSVAAVFCIWQLIFLPSIGVESEGPKETLSAPAQIVSSNLAADTPISKDDLVILEQVYTCRLIDLGNNYEPLLADRAKECLSISSSTELFNYLVVVSDLIVQDPAQSFGAALATTYGEWYPFCYGSYHDEDAPYVSVPGDVWAHPEWLAYYNDIPNLVERTRPGTKFLHQLHYIPILSLLYTPGVYLWLIIFILGFSLYTKRNRAITLSTLSPFFALALVIVAGPCASLRYALPFVFSLPLFIYLLFACMQHASSNKEVFR